MIVVIYRWFTEKNRNYNFCNVITYEKLSLDRLGPGVCLNGHLIMQACPLANTHRPQSLAPGPYINHIFGICI